MRALLIVLLGGVLFFAPAPGAMAGYSLHIETSNEKVKGLFAEGLDRLIDKRYPEAIMVYRRAMKLGANQPELLNNLGFGYMQMRDSKKAIECYKQALALKPDFAEAHVNLGEAYVQLGQLAPAKQEYETLLRINPEKAKALNEKIEAPANR